MTVSFLHPSPSFIKLLIGLILMASCSQIAYTSGKHSREDDDTSPVSLSKYTAVQTNPEASDASFSEKEPSPHPASQTRQGFDFILYDPDLSLEEKKRQLSAIASTYKRREAHIGEKDKDTYYSLLKQLQSLSL